MMNTEEKMDKFLNIVAMLHVCNDDEFSKNQPGMEEIEEKLGNLLDKKQARDLCDMIFGYGVSIKEYSVLQGIKLAIRIMDGSYIPTI